MDKREEQLKNEIAKKYFPQFDCTHILGNIDFSVAVTGEKDELFHGTQYLLWAEAKKGTKANIYDSLVQLIMTIGKERPFEKVAPPIFLGAFDEEKMAFIQYYKIQEVFFQNDFDWTVPPSDHSTKEFRQLKALVSQEIANRDAEAYYFYYGSADRALEKFIRKNFKVGKESVSLLPITKNNFTFIFYKWRTQVKPTIAVDWDGAKKKGVLEGHFFLADILSENNKSIFDKLHVVLRDDRYFVDQNLEDSNIFNSANIAFKDNMKAHNAFWSKYKRPPRKEFWDYFIERVDLLTPQDVRERKGSYFTPQIWVEKSQEYLADVLGEDWQDEYYIWDCCAGTGNMEAGLTNKYRVWASTLDVADVKIMHERIEKGANLLPAHCFQFDFLNDDLQDPKVPEDLRKILADEDRRKKLIIYINPPYAEAGNLDFVASGKGGQKTNVSVQHKTYEKYLDQIGIAGRELYAQFFIRIFNEISGCYLAEFSSLKIVQAPNFNEFRNVFLAKLESAFIVPANTFDNVSGKFPIGFFIWNLSIPKKFTSATADVYDSKANLIGEKYIDTCEGKLSINDWVINTRKRGGDNIGYMSSRSHDMAGINYNYFINLKDNVKSARGSWITTNNIRETTIFLAVCHCIESTWLNNKDQFLHPLSAWSTDKEFANDCLAFSLFHGQNKISSTLGTNHWIPFTEEEVGAKMAFDSHFMSDFIRGKHKHAPERDLFNQDPNTPQNTLSSGRAEEGLGLGIVFSPEAQAVFDAGRELWRYYHSFYGANPNASFYDIRAYFQGVNDKGKMNPDSQDEHYTELIQDLRQKQRILAKKIEIGVYKYGFLYSGAPAAEDEPNTPQDTLPAGRAREGLAPETNLKDIVKHHKPSSKKVINYNITVQGDLKVEQMIGKQQK